MRLLLLLLLLPFATLGQAGTVRGVVRAQGAAVPFASVGIKGTTRGTTADESGQFRLTEVPTGPQTLLVSAVGFGKKEQAVVVRPDTETVADVRLVSTENQLQDVVVSGTLAPVARSQSAVPIELYSPKFFQKNVSTCLPDNLQMVNGVRPQVNCGVCYTGDIRINGLPGPYTMVLIDGMPIVSSLSTVYGLSGIPTSLIERVEVVKGPASTLYGSEAVAGLINVITRNAATAPRLTVDALGTTQGEVSLDVGTSLKVGTASTLLSANVYHFTGNFDRNADGFLDVPHQRRASVFNKWQWTRPDELPASLAARYYYEDRMGGQLQWRPEFRGGDSIYGESIYTSRMEVLGQYGLRLPTAGRWLLSGSFNQHHQNSVYGTTSYIATQRVGFGQLTWSLPLSPRHGLLLGAATRFTHYDDNTPGTPRPDVVVLPGLFAQHEFHLTENATLLSGLRLDHDRRHGLIFSPRVNYKWATPDNRHVVRLGAGNGFRVVNLFTEDHAALTGARRVIIAEALQPERSWNGSASYQHAIETGAGLLTIDASAFWTRFQNQILPDYTSQPDAIVYRNLRGYAITRGGALSATLEAEPHLDISLGVTLLDAFQCRPPSEGGGPGRIAQVLSPPVSGTYAVSYTLPKLKLTFDYTGQLTSPMPLPTVPNDYRPARSPWYSLQNLQVTWRRSAKLQLYAGVKNLLDFLPRYALLRPQDPFDKHVNAPDNPFGYTFDTQYLYAPLQGRRGFAGVRLNL